MFPRVEASFELCEDYQDNILHRNMSSLAVFFGDLYGEPTLSFSGDFPGEYPEDFRGIS
jgi:hypothetical protein